MNRFNFLHFHMPNSFIFSIFFNTFPSLLRDESSICIYKSNNGLKKKRLFQSEKWGKRGLIQLKENGGDVEFTQIFFHVSDIFWKSLCPVSLQFYGIRVEKNATDCTRPFCKDLSRAWKGHTTITSQERRTRAAWGITEVKNENVRSKLLLERKIGNVVCFF